MSPSLQRLILIAGGLVVVVGVCVWWWTRSGEADTAAPDGTFWICRSAGCGNEFNISLAAFASHMEKHAGQPPKCPKCGKSEAVRAFKCPTCGKLFDAIRDRGKCPTCGKGTG